MLCAKFGPSLSRVPPVLLCYDMPLAAVCSLMDLAHLPSLADMCRAELMSLLMLHRSSMLVGTPRTGSSSGGKKSGGRRLTRLPGSVPSGLSRSALRQHASNGTGAGPSQSGSQELGPDHSEARMMNGHGNGQARPPSVESLSMSEAGPSHRSASLPLPGVMPLVRRGSLGSPQPVSFSNNCSIAVHDGRKNQFMQSTIAISQSSHALKIHKGSSCCEVDM